MHDDEQKSAGDRARDANTRGDTRRDMARDDGSHTGADRARSEAAAPALPSPAAIAGSGDSEMIAGEIILPSIPVDDLLDDHATELEEIRRWASTESGQAARVENPLGFANVRAHAAAHERALVQQQEVAAATSAARAPQSQPRRESK
jgi:hypothetical protein